MAIVMADAQPVGERELLRLTAQLIQRISDLEQRVHELEEWVQEVSEDMLERTATAG